MSTNETTDTRRTEPIDWTRVPDFDGRTVYWYRCMGDGFRLVVARIYEHQQSTGKWSWKVYDDRFKRFPEPVDSGICSTVGNGKTLAVRAYKALDPRLTT
jgi:hypothetical protein